MAKYTHCLPSELLIYDPHAAAPQSAQSSSGNHNQLWNGVLGHCTDVEMSPKTTSRKAYLKYKWIHVIIRIGHF